MCVPANLEYLCILFCAVFWAAAPGLVAVLPMWDSAYVSGTVTSQAIGFPLAHCCCCCCCCYFLAYQHKAVRDGSFRGRCLAGANVLHFYRYLPYLARGGVKACVCARVCVRSRGTITVWRGIPPSTAECSGSTCRPTSCGCPTSSFITGTRYTPRACHAADAE